MYILQTFVYLINNNTKTNNKMKNFYMITDKKGFPITEVIFETYEKALHESKMFLSSTKILTLYL